MPSLPCPCSAPIGEDPPVQRLQSLLQPGEPSAFAVRPGLRMTHRRGSSYDVRPRAGRLRRSRRNSVRVNREALLSGAVRAGSTTRSIVRRRCSMVSTRCSMVSRRCSMDSTRCSMDSTRCSMASRRCWTLPKPISTASRRSSSPSKRARDAHLRQRQAGQHGARPYDGSDDGNAGPDDPPRVAVHRDECSTVEAGFVSGTVAGDAGRPWPSGGTRRAPSCAGLSLGRDGNGNHLATCRPQEPQANGTVLHVVGKVISITVPRVCFRAPRTR